MADRELGFPHFTTIDALFCEGVDLPSIGNEGFLTRVLPRVVKTFKDSGKDVLRFEPPETINSKKTQTTLCICMDIDLMVYICD